MTTEVFQFNRLQLSLESYLTDRTQVVPVNVAISHEITIDHEVSQGYVLRPHLFISYIKDLSCIGNLFLM